MPALAVHAAGSCATRVRGAWPVCAHTHDHDPGPARHTRTRVCARALTRVYAQAVHAGPTGTPRTRVAQLPAAGPSRPAQPHRRCPRPAAPSAPRLQVLAHNGCNRVHEPTIVFPRQPGRPGVPSGLVDRDSEGPTWALRGCAVPDRPCGGQSGPRAAGRDAGCSHPCLRPPDEPWLRRAGLHNFSGWQWLVAPNHSCCTPEASTHVAGGAQGIRSRGRGLKTRVSSHSADFFRCLSQGNTHHF